MSFNNANNISIIKLKKKKAKNSFIQQELGGEKMEINDTLNHFDKREFNTVVIIYGFAEEKSFEGCASYLAFS